MTTEQIISAFVSAILGGLIGGGAIAGLFYRALKDRLREDLARDFASRDDVNGLGGRVTGAISMATMAKTTADANSDRLTRLEEAANVERQALSRTLSRIDKTLEDLDGRQRQAQSEITRTVTLLDALERRMDRHSPHE